MDTYVSQPRTRPGLDRNTARGPNYVAPAPEPKVRSANYIDGLLAQAPPYTSKEAEYRPLETRGPVVTPQRKYGEARPIDRMPLESERLRQARPNPVQRFWDAKMAAQNKNFESLGTLSALGVDPVRYSEVNAARAARRDQYKPQGMLDQAATGLGTLSSGIGPATLLAARMTRSPNQAGAAGGFIEGSNAYMDDRLAGKGFQPGNIAVQGLGGLLGAKYFDKYMPANTGVIPETVGRELGSEAAQSLVQDATANTIEGLKSAYRYLNPFNEARASTY